MTKTLVKVIQKEAVNFTLKIKKDNGKIWYRKMHLVQPAKVGTDNLLERIKASDPFPNKILAVKVTSVITCTK